MKPRSERERRSAQVSLWIDPLLLAAIDALARKRETSRVQCIRDAIYTAVFRSMRRGEEFESAPRVPPYDGAERVRSVAGKLVTVDENGLTTGELK